MSGRNASSFLLDLFYRTTSGEKRILSSSFLGLQDDWNKYVIFGSVNSLLKGYNQRIVETPTYIEIWDYEKPVIYSVEENEKQKSNLDWLEEEKRTFDDLTAQGQYDSLKRKQKHYKQMRFEIARLIDTNFDEQTKFLTLTFKQNITDLDYSNNEFKKFIKRLNYRIYKSKKSQIKYIATWEKQERGAIHYHIILFQFPFIKKADLTRIWSHGFIQINKTDVDSIENRGRYISKYFAKDLELKEHKKKAFFKSQNLQLPKEIKQLTNNIYETKNNHVIYEHTYIRKSPVFANERMGNEIEFEESKVRYRKMKRLRGR